MFSHLILAGGRGVRMFGEVGGCKALIRVASEHLIDYCVRELPEPAVETRILTSPEFEGSITGWTRSHPGTNFEVVTQPAQGTGAAVHELLKRSPEEVIVLTTCDIAGPPGALRDFYIEAILQARLARSRPFCGVATASVQSEEDSPIYVHVNQDLQVTAYGKNAPVSPLTFASARVMNLAFAEALIANFWTGATDTEVMGQTLRMLPGSLQAIHASAVFDVDDQWALGRARSLNKSPGSSIDK